MSATTLTPLQWPEEFYAEKPKHDSVWTHIPVIGRILEFYSDPSPDAIDVIIAKVQRQLAARDKPNPTIWGDDPRRVDLGTFICTVAQEHYSWPNDHFIPDDLFDIVFLIPWDDLRSVEDVMAIEEHLGIRIADSEVEEWGGKTVGQIVDDLLQKRNR